MAFKRVKPCFQGSDYPCHGRHEVKTFVSVFWSAPGSLLKLRCSCVGLAISWVQMVQDGCKGMQTISEDHEVILSMLSHPITGGLGRLRCQSSSKGRILFCSLPRGHNDRLGPRSEAFMTAMAQIWVEEVLGSWARWKGKESEIEDLSTPFNVSQHLFSCLCISQRGFVCLKVQCSSRGSALCPDACSDIFMYTYSDIEPDANFEICFDQQSGILFDMLSDISFFLTCFLTFDVAMMLT